jgi:hypothetical protein
MIWIPVIFICVAQGCGFMQGQATYTERGCAEQLQAIISELGAAQQRGEVLQFSTTCVSGNNI